MLKQDLKSNQCNKISTEFTVFSLYLISRLLYRIKTKHEAGQKYKTKRLAISKVYGSEKINTQCLILSGGNRIVLIRPKLSLVNVNILDRYNDVR